MKVRLGTAVVIVAAFMVAITLSFNVGRWAGSRGAITDADAMAWAQAHGYGPAAAAKIEREPAEPKGIVPLVAGSGHAPAPVEIAERVEAKEDPSEVAGSLTASCECGKDCECLSTSPLDLTEAAPAWPTADYLGGYCGFRVVRAGGAPLGKIEWSGYIIGPDGKRVVERGPIPMQDVELQVAPEAVGVEPSWRLDLLGGLSGGERAGVEAGVAWTGRSRLGYYLLGEWQPGSGADPATWRAHGGVRLRIR